MKFSMIGFCARAQGSWEELPPETFVISLHPTPTPFSTQREVEGEEELQNCGRIGVRSLSWPVSAFPGSALCEDALSRSSVLSLLFRGILVAQAPPVSLGPVPCMGVLQGVGSPAGES